jgi:hypothetical protein
MRPALFALLLRLWRLPRRLGAWLPGGLWLGAMLLSFGGQAQNYTLDKTHYGTVILASGDTLRGVFSVNLTNDVVQIEQRSAIKTFSARQIEQFSFEDGDNKTTRYFYSLPFAAAGSYKAPWFFEMLHEGPYLSLLARQMLVYESVPTYNGFSGYTSLASVPRISYDYFFLTEKEGIVRYSQRRKELLQALKDLNEEIEKFIKEQRLSVTNRADLERIVEHYNLIRLSGERAPATTSSPAAKP